MEIAAKIEVPEPASAGKKRQIFYEFDRLADGGMLELLVCDYPEAQALLREFQERYDHAFEWWPVQRSAPQTRVLVSHRDAGQPRTITEFLGADHHRLTRLWRDFLSIESACAMGHETMHTLDAHHLDAPKDALAQFIFGLRRHIRMEEECFFPRFDAKRGVPGPTTVMRAEHEQIRSALAVLEQLLDVPDCALIIQSIERHPAHPTMLFNSHDLKEERILYPMADGILSPEEVHDLIRTMQAV